MNFSDSYIEDIRAYSLVNIIGQYVSLKKAGNSFTGLCPFHDERTPSFNVRPGKGYYCFGCNAKGKNAIDFIMRYEKKNFTEAVKYIATIAGNRKEVAYIKPKLKTLQQPLKNIDYIPAQKLAANLLAYKQNSLYSFFKGHFGESITSETFRRYCVCSCKSLGNGTTLFIQRDINANIRQLKAIVYNETTGKRLREPNFLPKIIGRDLVGYDKNLVQCFFGENLITGNKLRIAIVESEKTALICSLWYPQFIWIATGGKNGCKWTNIEVCKVLKNREIVLFPDKGIDCFELWQQRANEIKNMIPCKIIVSDILERSESEMAIVAGEDLADYLLKIKWQQTLKA